MDDVFILEDDKSNIQAIIEDKPKNLISKLVENSYDFIEFIEKGGEANLYFLDDLVLGELTFIKNCSYLLKQKPSAKIFYTGSVPDREQKDFCKEHNIKLIDKFDIWKVAEKELSK